MGHLHGIIIDAATREKREAKVHILASNGHFQAPSDSVLKVGPGRPFFYCDGEFMVNVPAGPTDILVERGTEFAPLRQVVRMPARGTQEVELELRRWTDLQSQHWYPGNTHIHYDEKEQRPDDRLRLEPHLQDYRVTIVSILQRRELPYASNKYPLGVLTEFSTAHHLVDIGEENRHNDQPWSFGYGHVMFLNIRNVVEPVSRGVLVSDFDPDYPPLCFACDEAREQGGLVIWCHNGQGMEAPVAAALGKLDAFNLFDPYWMDPEYDLWYKMLNCGLHLPASTGTDWFVCSNNRVYVQTEGEFTYDEWLAAMRQGRTFITNGPALFLGINGRGPGDTLDASPGTPAEAEVSWLSHYPVNRIEILRNGEVVAAQDFPEGSEAGEWKAEVPLASDGWIAARCSGSARDSFDHAIYAHTSPVHLRIGPPNPSLPDCAAYFVRALDRSIDWVQTKGRFAKNKQRDEVLDLFRQGREFYQARQQ